MKNIFVTIAFFVASSQTLAAPSFVNLTEDQAKTALREFNASAVHSTLTSGSFPKVIGFQLGALGGVTKVPGIDGLVSEEFGYLPIGGVYGTLQAPFGVGAELIWLPKITVQGVSVQNISFAGTFDLASRLGLDSLIGWRLRGAYGTMSGDYSQVISTVPLDINYKSTSYLFDTTVSLAFLPIISPYLSVGYVSSTGELNVSGNGTIFAFAGRNYSDKNAGMLVALGAEIQLGFLMLGAEYSRHYETDRYLGKLGVGF